MRVFVAVDNHSNRCAALEFDVALAAGRAARTLDRAVESYGKPRAIRTNNAPEFTSRAYNAWAHSHSIEHHFIRAVKPVEDASTESCNGRPRDGLLNQHCFKDPHRAQNHGED